MKRNNDCIKAVLNHVIENVNVVFDTSHVGYDGISLLSVINNLSEDGTYKAEEVLHSCMYASFLGLIWADKRIEPKNIIASTIDILDVTPAGYEFLEQNS